jgi:ATP-dependent Lon protease
MLGDVMKDSVQIASSVAWRLAIKLSKNKIHSNILSNVSISSSNSNNNDNENKSGLHIHFPDGATPKDGPSAGIAICLAIVSVLSGYPINQKIAMTGEIDLEGNVLPIGGLDSKIQGAKLNNVSKILIPYSNKEDIDYLLKNEKIDAKDLELIYVNHIDEVIKIGLVIN